MRVEFCVLGPLEIRSDGTEIALGAPKLRALLIALLLDVNRVVPTDRLVDDLWGDDATPQAVPSLRSYLSNLRRLLVAVDGSVAITSRGPGYVLEADPTMVDSVRFEQAVRQGRELLTQGRSLDASTVLDEALALWRGPALADVADLAFARATAARLGELRLAAIEDRLDALLRAGRHAEVVAEAEALATDHPLRERPRALLMLALYRTGRAPEALAVHRAFRRELADEAGLDPSARIDALAAAVLRRDPVLDGTAPPTGPASERGGDFGPVPLENDLEVAPVAAGSRVDEDVGLVGRVGEQQRLAAYLSDLDRGRGGVLLLGGEPGIGKTALLRRLTADARAAAIPVAWGRCHEARSTPAFWPWVQVLRSLSETLSDADLERCTAGTAAAVAHLVPEIAERTGRRELPDGADPHAARFALQLAVTTFIGRVASDRGLVVVVDDLHWSDVASLELAAFLGGHARHDRVLLAGSYRDTASAASHDLDALLASLAREEGSGTIRLAGLSAGETGELAAQVAGTSMAPAVAEVLHRRAGGNPFFVRQLAQLQAESDGEVRADAIPVGVRHVLVQRLQLLPDEVRRTLETASVFGQEFDARPLGRCRALPLAEVLDHLDVAVAHGLVEGASGATAWRFVHALIRDALHDQLPPGRMVRLHVDAADALEQQERPPVQAIARHLWLAADLVEDERPIVWLRAAAEEALAVYAYDQGEQYLRKVLHLLDHRPEPACSLELEVRLRLVQVLVGLHGWSADGIAEVASRARDLAAEVGGGPELTSLWWSRWAFSMTRGDLDEASALSHQLLADVAELGTPPERVAGHVAVAYTSLFHPGGIDPVMEHLELASRAEALADPAALSLTPERLVVARRITLAMAQAFQGQEELALATVADAITTAQGTGVAFSEGYARMFAGFAMSILDRPEDARALSDPGLALCEELGLEHLANLTVPANAWACARTSGDPAVQARRIEAAIEGLSAVGHRHAMPFWWTLLAEVELLAGNSEAAERALDAGRALGEELGETVYETAMARVRALIEAGAT